MAPSTTRFAGGPPPLAGEDLELLVREVTTCDRELRYCGE